MVPDERADGAPRSLGTTARRASGPDGRRLLTALFVVHLVLLVWLVLWKLEAPWIGAAASLPRPLKLVPFVAAGGAGPSAPLEVAANVVLFVPFGLYLGLLAPSRRAWQQAVVLAGASLVLEAAQHVLSVGSFDVTDVVANTAGGLAGLGLLALLRRRLGARTSSVLGRACAVGTVLAVVVVCGYLASPLHHPQQRDVIVSPT